MKKVNPFKNSDSNKRYYTFDFYLRRKYGCKCAKIALDGGFTCPNRDGTKGTGGCTFCSSSGSGDFCADASLTVYEQFKKQKLVYERKWGDVKYIQYFQSHSNTYGQIGKIRQLLDDALKISNTVGISIATRPDCLQNDIISLLREYAVKTDLTVELGLQSIHDVTGKKINRCCDYSEFLEGYERLSGIDVCVHIINGLPGEDKDMMLQTAKEIARINPKFLKIHLLHIISGTKMAEDYLSGCFKLPTREEYVDCVVSQLELLPGDMVIERVTGDGAPENLIAPEWSKKKFCVINEIDKEFVRRNTYQGIFSK